MAITYQKIQGSGSFISRIFQQYIDYVQTGKVYTMPDLEMNKIRASGISRVQACLSESSFGVVSAAHPGLAGEEAEQRLTLLCRAVHQLGYEFVPVKGDWLGHDSTVVFNKPSIFAIGISFEKARGLACAQQQDQFIFGEKTRFAVYDPERDEPLTGGRDMHIDLDETQLGWYKKWKGHEFHLERFQTSISRIAYIQGKRTERLSARELFGEGFAMSRLRQFRLDKGFFRMGIETGLELPYELIAIKGPHSYWGIKRAE